MTLWILIRFLYYPQYRNRELACSYFMLGSMVFLVTLCLKDVNVSLGFAFGLFAMFSILSYRTETVSVSQISYLFISIGLAVLNAACLLHPLMQMGMNALVLFLTVSAQNRFSMCFL